MQIKKAEFIKSIKLKEDYFNNEYPEIAICGKSNAGKSSLINYITNNGKLARVSKQPGKTRLINYFLINEKFYIVDLPGYGFAKASKTEINSWAHMMEGYFEVARNLKGLIILADIRHNPTADDRRMVQFAEYNCIPYIVAATKADKIAKSKRKNEAVRISKNIGATIPPNVVPVSSLIKWGSSELLSQIEGMLQ